MCVRGTGGGGGGHFNYNIDRNAHVRYHNNNITAWRILRL